MSHFYRLTMFCLLCMLANETIANQYNVPVQLDYTLIKRVLTTQLYKGSDNSAELWNDKKGCSFLKLANPKLSGSKGQIKMLNDVQAQFGTKFGGQCMTLLNWSGVLETLQKPTLSADHTVLSLPVTQASAYDAAGHQLTIDKLQDLIKRVAEPKLAEVKVDLNESRDDIERTVTDYLPKENAAEAKEIIKSLKFADVEANDNGVGVKVSFEAALKKIEKKPAAPFTEAEQKQWQTLWRNGTRC